MIQNIQRAIERHRLVRGGEHILAAVSGGADSMALLHVLDRLRPDLDCTLSVAHLHHGLRGAEADADQAFVQEQAAARGLACAVGRVDVAGIARAEGISIEMAARRARYGFLADVASASGAHAIATGHTLDDQAETVLLRLSRGAGAAGLGGIGHVSRMNEIRVIRPLRDCRRADLEQMLREAGIPWREDASNRDLAMLRNRVRHQVLPLLARDINPNIVDVLSRTAEILRADDACLDDMARRDMPDVRCAEDPHAIDVGALRQRPLALRRRLLRLWLGASGVDEDRLDFDLIHRLEHLTAGVEGTQEVAVGGGMSAVRTYGVLKLCAEPVVPAPAFVERISIPGETRLPDCGCLVRTRESTGIIATPPAGPGVLPAAGSLGRGAVGESSVYVRSWRSGDRIRPTGMAGSIKLQDLYVNHKVPRARRGGIPVFECRGEVVWIPGYRVARGWEVPGPDAPSLSFHVEALGRP